MARPKRPYVLAVYAKNSPGFDGERNPYTAKKFVLVVGEERDADQESARLRKEDGTPAEVLLVRMSPFP